MSLLATMAAERYVAAAIGALTLLPVLLHALLSRRLFWTPNVVTLLLVFYVVFFPLRALVLLSSGHTAVLFTRFPTDRTLLAVVLVGAATSMSILVCSFHAVVRRASQHVSVRASQRVHIRTSKPTLALVGAVLLGVAFLGLGIMILADGGIAQVFVKYASHSKAARAVGAEAIGLSMWSIFSGLGMWLWAASILFEQPRSRGNKALRGRWRWLPIGVVLGVMATLFASRLDLILSGLGLLCIWWFAGRRISKPLIAALAVVFVFFGPTLVAWRTGNQTVGGSLGLGTISGYPVLDAGMAAMSDSGAIRSELRNPARWLNLPLYLVPRLVWADKPDLNTRTLDFMIAQRLGNENQKNTGSPPGYIADLWLMGGWPLVLVGSALFGGSLAFVHCSLIRRSERGDTSPVDAVCYALLVVFAFTYMKDGDLLATSVGGARLVAYTLGALALAGYRFRNRVAVMPLQGNAPTLTPSVGVHQV